MARVDHLNGPFQRLARAQSKHWDVVIEPSGTNCSTDGNTIKFPWNSDDIDSIPFQVINGYLDHEVGHICEEREHVIANEETPLAIINKIKNSTLAMLFNIFLDISMERKRSLTLPGVAANLRSTNEYLIGLIAKKYEKLAFWGAIGAAIIAKSRKINISWLTEKQQEFLEEIQEEIDLATQTVWGRECMKLANRVYAKSKKGGKGGENSNVCKEREKNESGKDGNIGHGNTKNKEGEDEKEEDDCKSEKDNKNHKEGKRTEKTSDGIDTESTEKCFPKDNDDVSIDIGDVEEDMVESDKSDTLREILGSHIKEESEKQAHSQDGYIPDPKAVALDKWIIPKESSTAPKEYALIKSEIGGQIATIKAKFIRVIKVMERSRIEYDKDHGRIDVSGLHRLSFGSKNVFYSCIEGESVSSVVEILIDMSGSMGCSDNPRTRSHHARLTVISLSEALSSIGVPFEVIGFHNRPCNSRLITTKGYNPFVHRFPFEFFIFKEFSETLRATRYRMISITGWNENVDGEALIEVAKRLIIRPEKRKIMFVISDGYPSCPGLFVANKGNVGCAHLSKSIRDVRKTGIQLIGIGLNHTGVEHFYGEENSVIVDDLDDTASKIFDVVKRTIVGKPSRRHQS